ncbi:MGMT family protein [Nakamurella sp. YIM 132084]|uniref:MGMT family protein n=2 Tax=Nakamurella leprariae TaxID=2803911 RepID=A0A938YA14_9ACTN|nr:MGMT family protein [Nakamurella leprariae]
MLEVVRAVPAGTVVTYGDIAARAGSPSARLAGWVLSNLADESVPWHRVVRADGRMAAHLAVEQRTLLAAEGVLSVDGRVDLRRFRHRPGRDDGLSG